MVACGSPAKREGGSSAWALVGKGYVDLKLGRSLRPPRDPRPCGLAFIVDAARHATQSIKTNFMVQDQFWLIPLRHG